MLAEQRVPDHELRMIGGEVGGFRPDGDVADGVDALVGGAQPPVDVDAVRLVADAGRVEIEVFDIRPAPDGDEKMTAGHGLGAVGRRDVDLDPRQHAPHLRDRDTDTQRDAFAFERVEHDGGAFGIVARKRRRRFEHGDVGAEPPKGLRQFEADRAGADDDEMTRAIGEIEHGVAGEVRRVGKAGDRRQRRQRAGGDDEAPRRDGEVAGGDGARIQKPRGAVDDAHAEAGQTLPRFARRHGAGDVAQVRLHGGEIDAEARRLEPEMRGIADDIGALGGHRERRGRHAAAVAGAIAHCVFGASLDQHHRHAEGGRRRRRGTAGRAGADDADVRFKLLLKLLRHRPHTSAG